MTKTRYLDVYNKTHGCCSSVTPGMGAWSGTDGQEIIVTVNDGGG